MFDPECYRLAEYFLGENLAHAEEKTELAQLIQTTIEDWIGQKTAEILRKINEAIPAERARLDALLAQLRE